jgi:5-methylcytosine-specific restriction protein B
MSTPEQPQVPVFQEYFNPILEVLRAHGGSMAIEELERRVSAHMKLGDAVLAIPHDPKNPDRSEVGYRMAWARTYLKKAGLLENPQRGVWSIARDGATTGPIDAYAVASKVAKGEAPDVKGQPPELTEELVEEESSAARVGPTLAAQLVALREQLAASGALLPPKEASLILARFRDRFGPSALSGLDGEALLLHMHGRGKKKESLVYWLEFKDDEEFPAARFGSIGGGSALKFGIYQSAESGAWMTGTGHQQVRLSLEDAVAKARSQRDQLAEAARVLESAGPSDAVDYGGLQKRLEQVAPDVAETSWGHKYLALLFPTLLEPFHGTDYQRHQLRKLLKLPAEGRYANARIFVGVGRQLGMSLLDLSVVLHRRNGPPHLYWRVGTTIDEKRFWPGMRDGGYVAVGWDKLGDLSGIEASKQGREAVRERMAVHYPGADNVVSRQAGQCFQFARAMQDRDLVVAMEGQTVRGVGRVISPYEYVPAGSPMPHRRRVEWLLIDDWKLPDLEGYLTTFVQLQKSQRNLIEIESRLLAPRQPVTAPVPFPSPVTTATADAAPLPPLIPLTGILARVESVLQRKRQVILYGPPGTGKTYWAERAANELAARAWFGVPAEKLTEAQKSKLKDAAAIEMCSFHPAYGYEDFLEGFRPVQASSAVGFVLRDGIFKRVCDRASRDTAHPYFLIIDEINRGDIPRIFGELLTILEKEKRGKTITLPLSGKTFSVPDNVHVLGTMNTADRSIALLNAALRRRFGFVELLPDSGALGTASAGSIPLGSWLDALNKRVLEHAGRDARNLQIGHSYLMPDGAPLRELSRFAEVLRDDILPLLEEYCYEDFDSLERILGSTLVNKKDKRVAHHLFEPDRHDELVDALLSAFNEITATKAAVEADAAGGDKEPEDEDEVTVGEGSGK